MLSLLISVVLLAAAGSSPAGSPKSEPALRVWRAKPLVVVGTDFRAGESVRIVALGHGGRRAKTAVAGRRGGFKVTLPARKTIGCAPTIVTATGSKGSKATLTARAACMTVPPPRR